MEAFSFTRSDAVWTSLEEFQGKLAPGDSSPPRVLHHHTNSLVHLPAPLAQSLPSAEPAGEAEATQATGPGKMMPWDPFVRQGDSLFEQVQYHPRKQKAPSLGFTRSARTSSWFARQSSDPEDPGTSSLQGTPTSYPPRSSQV